VGAVAAAQRDLLPIGLFLIALPLLSLLAMIPSRWRLRTARILPDEAVPVGQPVGWRVGIEAGGLNPGGTGELVETLDPALGPDVHVFFGQTLRAQYVTAEVRATALRRGRHTVGPARVALRHALGFAAVRRTTPETGQVVVTPAVTALGAKGDVPTANGGTQAPLGRAGVTSIDDAAIREYVDGDDIRRIHWRSTAHLGHFMVRREDSTWDPRAYILLDTRSDTFDEERPDPRFEAMITLVASMTVHLLHSGYSVNLADTCGGMQALDADPLVAHQEALLLLADADTQDGSLVIPPDIGRRSDTVIAVLAHAGPRDAQVLTTSARNGRALVMSGGPLPALDTQTTEMFADAGWRVVQIDVDTPPDLAWRTIVGGGGR